MRTDVAGYQAAISAFVGANKNYSSGKLVIVDPHLKGDVHFKLGTDEVMVIGLNGAKQDQLMVDLYELAGQGYTICLPVEMGGKNPGDYESLALSDLAEAVVGMSTESSRLDELGFDHSYHNAFKTLAAFNEWVSQQGGIDKVDDTTLTAAMQKGSSTVGGAFKNMAWAVGMSAGATSAGPLSELDPKYKAAFLQGVTEVKQHAQAEADRKKNEDVITTLGTKIAALTIPTQADIRRKRSFTAVESGIQQAEALIQAAEKSLEALYQLTELQEEKRQLEQRKALLAKPPEGEDEMSKLLAAAFASADTSGQVREIQLRLDEIDSTLIARETLASLISQEKDKLAKQKAAVAETKAQLSKGVDVVKQFLTDGFFPSGELTHVDAAAALKPLLGKEDASAPQKKTYAGAFTLGDKTKEEVGELLKGYQAKNGPFTLLLLMQDPQSPTGPAIDTVVEIEVDAANVIQHMAHLDPAQVKGPGAVLAAGHPIFDAVVPAVRDGLGAGYTLTAAAGFFSHNGVDAAQKSSTPGVHNAVLEIARAYESTLVSDAKKADLKDADAAKHQFALVQMMAEASGNKQFDMAALVQADAAHVTKYKEVAVFKAGDFIYLPVLEQKRLVHELNSFVEFKALEIEAGGATPVEPLHKDKAFITLCQDYMKANKGQPPLEVCHVDVQRVLIRMIALDQKRDALKAALLTDAKALYKDLEAKAVVLDAEIKKIGTPILADTKKLKAEKEGQAAALRTSMTRIAEDGMAFMRNCDADIKSANFLEDFDVLAASNPIVRDYPFPNFGGLLVTAKAECGESLAALAVADDAGKKKGAAATATFAEKSEGKRLDAFTEFLRSQNSKDLRKIVKAVTDQLKTWKSEGFKSVAFDVAKREETTAGAATTVDAVKVDERLCEVRGVLTLTKQDNSTVKADTVLTRTVDPAKPGEVVRRCEFTVTSGQLTEVEQWKAQCELAAAQSMSERQTAAKGGVVDKSIMLSIDDASPKVPNQELTLSGGKKIKVDGLSRDEAIMLQVYLTAGFGPARCNTVTISEKGEVVYEKRGIREVPLSPVLFPPVAKEFPKLPDGIPRKEERPAGKDGVFVDFKMEFTSKKYPNPKGLDEKEQAKAILDNVRKLQTLGYTEVGITYSANSAETQALKAYYAGGCKDPKPTFGGNQGEVMSAVMTLLSTPEYSDLLQVFRVVPITTMNQGESASYVAGDHGLDKSLEAAKTLVTGGGALLGWQNQSTPTGRYAVGGDISGPLPAAVDTKIQTDLAALKTDFGPEHKKPPGLVL